MSVLKFIDEKTEKLLDEGYVIIKDLVTKKMLKFIDSLDALV